MKTELCLVICFFVGVLLFYLLKQSCGCGAVVEGLRTTTPCNGSLVPEFTILDQEGNIAYSGDGQCSDILHGDCTPDSYYQVVKEHGGRLTYRQCHPDKRNNQCVARFSRCLVPPVVVGGGVNNRDPVPDPPMGCCIRSGNH